MSRTPDAPSTEEYILPSAEALLAGTLALMTGCAQHNAPSEQRSLMANKVVSNLGQLSEHPEFSVPMRRMLGNLCARWMQDSGSTTTGSPRVFTAPAPARWQ